MYSYLKFSLKVQISLTIQSHHFSTWVDSWQINLVWVDAHGKLISWPWVFYISLTFSSVMWNMLSYTIWDCLESGQYPIEWWEKVCFVHRLARLVNRPRSHNKLWLFLQSISNFLCVFTLSSREHRSTKLYIFCICKYCWCGIVCCCLHNVWWFENNSKKDVTLNS